MMLQDESRIRDQKIYYHLSRSAGFIVYSIYYSEESYKNDVTIRYLRQTQCVFVPYLRDKKAASYILYAEQELLV